MCKIIEIKILEIAELSSINAGMLLFTHHSPFFISLYLFLIKFKIVSLHFKSQTRTVVSGNSPDFTIPPDFQYISY